MFKNIERRYILAGVCIGILLFMGVLINVPVKSRATAGTLSFASAVNYATPAGQQNYVAKGSFNSSTDSISDIAVVGGGNEGSLRIYLGNADGTFTLGSTVSVNPGSDLKDLITADIDGDSKTDLIFLDTTSNIVWWFLGDGSGGFLGSSGNIGVNGGAVPTSVAAGDFGNGQIDLAVADGTGHVTILNGDGMGDFTAGAIIDVNSGTALISIVVGDFGSGNRDLAVADATGNIWIVTNDGSANFTLVGSHVSGSGVSISSLITADLGNGHADLVSLNKSFNGISVAVGDGSGSFSTATYTPSFACSDGCITAVSAVDLNHDGHLDLAISNDQSGGVHILAGDGTGSFTDLGNFTGDIGSSIVSGDFNGDGYGDLVLGNDTSNHFAVLLNTMNLADTYTLTGTAVGLQLNSSQSFTVTPNGVFTGDITITPDDGESAIVLSFSNSSNPQTFAIHPSIIGNVTLTPTNNGSLTDPSAFVYNSSHVAFSGPTGFDTGAAPWASVSGDFNGDHKVDVAVANSEDHTVSIFFGNNTGTFADQVVYDVVGNPFGITANDFDLDDDQDLATANADGTVSILLNDGHGVFVLDSVITVNGSSGVLEAITSGDFGSGYRDLAVTDNDNRVIILIGDGTGNFIVGSPISVGANPRSIVAGDFNNDGDADLAVANRDDNTIQILTGNGDDTFSAGIPFSGGGVHPVSIATLDYNHDNFPDLAVANAGGTVDVLMNGGDDGFSISFDYEIPGVPTFVTTGYFNDDVYQDLAVDILDDSGNGSIKLFLGDGTGLFSRPVNYQVALGLSSISVADFNGDEAQDIVAITAGNNGLYLFLNNWAGTATNFTVTGPSSGYVNQESTDFTLTPNGTFTGSVRISASGGGLDVTYPPLYFNNSSTPQTFTITPTAVGEVTIGNSNNGGLVDNDDPLIYTVTTAPLPDSGGGFAPPVNVVAQATQDTAAITAAVVKEEAIKKQEITLSDNTLKFGDQGNDVKELQKALNTINYNTPEPINATNDITTPSTDSPTPLVVDGIFGRITKSVVLCFQKAYSLVADGVVGINTRTMIQSVLSALR